MFNSLIVVAVAAAILVPAASAHASGPHWCRQGDPPIYASLQISCVFAGQIVTEYVDVCHESRDCHMRALSPATHVRYAIVCDRTGTAGYDGTVDCSATASSAVWTRFSANI